MKYGNHIPVDHAYKIMQDLEAGLAYTPDERTERRMWTEPFLMPPSECMNSLFGVMRYHNGKPTGNFHRGVDL